MSAGAPHNPDDYCYRHPDRQSFVLCQRCTRTICPECQTQAAVGVICPECMAADRKATPPRVRRARTSLRTLDSRPIVTYWIAGLTAAVSLIAMIPNLPIIDWLAYHPGFMVPSIGVFQPWRAVTVLLVHGGFLHVALNLLALWLLGRSLEPLLGHWRFLALYLLSGIGGSAAVSLIAPGQSVVGASGAIFGLLGALLVIGRHIGAPITGIVIILGINLVISFLPGFNISWQAHVGGFVVGALTAFVLARTRKASQRGLQIGILVAIAILVTLVPVAIAPALWGIV